MASKKPAITAERLQTQGQSEYRQGDFKAALDTFDMALQAEPQDEIGTLDNRSATLEKLSRTDEALRDGRRMIKLAPEDPRVSSPHI